ncbi:MAG: ABC transporter permease [Pseudomonadota bacterium]|nr:MAG: ABC transporter permease [Pseudomonadota bacterium]
MNVTLRFAWRNLWRHARRTWLTASAIAFSAALLVFMITLQLGAYDMMIDTSLRVYTGQLQVQRSGYLDKPQMRSTVPEAAALAAELRAAGFPAVAARAQGFALASSGSRSYGVPVSGVEPKYEPLVSTIPKRLAQGRYLREADAYEAVIGATLARNLKIKVGDELTLLGSGRDGSVAATIVPVVGIFDSGNPELDRHLVQLPLAAFQEVFSMGSDAHAIVLSGMELRELPKAATRARALLPADRELVVLEWQELLPGIEQAIEADMVQNWFTYIILIIVVTFSILNTFLMSVLERTREFGVMLALGATPYRIGSLVMVESVLLALLGLGIGLVVGGGLAVYFHLEGFTFPGMAELYAQFGLPGRIHAKLSFNAIAVGPAVIFLFTVVAALYPALRIRRLAPVEAMHAV